MSDRKRTLVNAAARYLVNPVSRRIVGRIPGWVLVETTGRRSGNPHRVPAAGAERGDSIWIVAEHGGDADWIRNVRADPRVRVRTRGRWRRGTAHLLPDDDAAARMRDLNLVARVGLRAVATEPLTVRIDLDPGDADG